MRIILINSLLVLGISLCTEVIAGQNAFELCFPHSGCVDIQTARKRPTAHSLSQHKPLVLDRDSASLLSGADDVFATPAPPVDIGSSQAIIAVIRKPSTQGSPEGFCGAGHEDYLALISVDRGNFRLYDQVPLQSCLKSISLVSDDGDDPREAIKRASTPWLISYSVSSSPDFDVKSYRVRSENGKLVIEQEGMVGTPTN